MAGADQPEARAWLREALLGGVDAALELGLPSSPVLAYPQAWYGLLGGDVAELGALTLERLQDRARSVEARLGARCFLDTIASFVRGERDRPVAPDVAARANEVLAASVRSLAAILADPAEPVVLKDGIARKATWWLAAEIPDLQTAGALPAVELPRWRDVKERKDPAVLRDLSGRVRLDEVVSVLGSAGQLDPERVMCAIRLAAPLAAWSQPAPERLEAPLRALVSTSLTLSWTIKGQPHVFDLAREALAAEAEALIRGSV